MKFFGKAFCLMVISIGPLTAMKSKEWYPAFIETEDSKFFYGPLSPQSKLHHSLSHLIRQLDEKQQSSRFKEAATQVSTLLHYLNNHIPNEKTLPAAKIDAVRVLEEGIAQLPSLSLSDALSIDHYKSKMSMFIQELKAICSESDSAEKR